MGEQGVSTWNEENRWYVRLMKLAHDLAMDGRGQEAQDLRVAATHARNYRWLRDHSDPGGCTYYLASESTLARFNDPSEVDRIIAADIAKLVPTPARTTMNAPDLGVIAPSNAGLVVSDRIAELEAELNRMIAARNRDHQQALANGAAAAAERERREAAEAVIHTCQWAMRQPLDGWKGECERKALDEARAHFARYARD